MFVKCVSDIFLSHFLSALLCEVPYLLIEHTEKEHDIYQHVNTHTNIHILISDSHMRGIGKSCHADWYLFYIFRNINIKYISYTCMK